MAAAFAHIGEIEDCRIARDRESGRVTTNNILLLIIINSHVDSDILISKHKTVQSNPWLLPALKSTAVLLKSISQFLRLQDPLVADLEEKEEEEEVVAILEEEEEVILEEEGEVILEVEGEVILGEDLEEEEEILEEEGEVEMLVLLSRIRLLRLEILFQEASLD